MVSTGYPVALLAGTANANNPLIRIPQVVYNEGRSQTPPVAKSSD
jgi:hypothetical protein